MTKEIKINDNTYLFVEVPYDSCNFTLHDNDGVTYDSIIEETKTGESWGFIDLEKGGYEIISTTKDITEEQAESIVGRKFGNGYYEFLKVGSMRVASMKHAFPFKTAKESLQSLIQSNGLNINKTYLILRQNDIK